MIGWARTRHKCRIKGDLPHDSSDQNRSSGSAVVRLRAPELCPDAPSSPHDVEIVWGTSFQLAVLSSRLKWTDLLLASGGESAHVGYRQPEILVGVYRGVVDTDFVVEMGAGAASALADVSDGVSAVDTLA